MYLKILPHNQKQGKKKKWTTVCNIQSDEGFTAAHPPTLVLSILFCKKEQAATGN